MPDPVAGAMNSSNVNGVQASNDTVQSVEEEWDDLALSLLFDIETYDWDTSVSTSTTPTATRPATPTGGAFALCASVDSSSSVAIADTLPASQYSASTASITEELDVYDDPEYKERDKGTQSAVFTRSSSDQQLPTFDRQDGENVTFATGSPLKGVAHLVLDAEVSGAGEGSDSSLKLEKKTQGTVFSIPSKDLASPVLDRQNRETQDATESPLKENESLVPNVNEAETTGLAQLAEAARSTPEWWGEFVRDYRAKHKRARSTSDDEGEGKGEKQQTTTRTKRKKRLSISEQQAKHRQVVTPNPEPGATTILSSEHDAVRESQIHLAPVLEKELKARKAATVQPSPTTDAALANNPYASLLLWKAPTGIPLPPPMAIPALPLVMYSIGLSPIAGALLASSSSTHTMSLALASGLYAANPSMVACPGASLPSHSMSVFASNPYAALASMPSRPPTQHLVDAPAAPLASDMDNIRIPTLPDFGAPIASLPHTQVTPVIETVFIDLTPVVTNAMTMDPPKAEVRLRTRSPIKNQTHSVLDG